MKSAPALETMKAHATFSASGSDRWLSCPGSIKLSESAPPEAESKYAAEGTDAHTCLEVFLKNGRAKTGPTGALLRKTYSAGMVNHALEAAEYLWDLTPKGVELLAETRVDLSFVAPGMFGTSDAAILEFFGRLTVADFKYGAGIAVDPEENSQLIYYALGIAHLYDYDFAEVALVIIQPRADHPSGKTIREWVISVEELKAWIPIFEAGVAAALAPKPELAAGDWCRFCRAKPICPEISSGAMRAAKLDFAPDATDGEMIQAPDLATLPMVDLSSALRAADKLEVWIAAVRKFAWDTLEAGGQVPGFKLVPKRGQRRWLDENGTSVEARALYGHAAFSKPELLSPAQLEKIGNGAAKDFVLARTETVSSGRAVVPDTDKREAVTSAAQDFAPAAPPEVIRKPAYQATRALPKKKK